ncbi:hypothetical protein VTI74DRAFT_899 [Chaetomium olivicolor]
MAASTTSQYYIHGSSDMTAYVNLSPDYKKRPTRAPSRAPRSRSTALSTGTARTWRRTELIPWTTAAINKGKVYYHFSLMRKDNKAPATTHEHQIAFFESYFTELKAGWLSGAAGVGFWHSTGSDPLTLKVVPVSASTSSNGTDWHVGMLVLPRSGYADTTEDYYRSGVYIESGSLTTSVVDPGSAPGGGSSSSSGPRRHRQGCLGAEHLDHELRGLRPHLAERLHRVAVVAVRRHQPYTGCKTCVSTCKYVNDWYSQCL